METNAALGRPSGGGRSAEENRRHILDAAERCFARLGIDATTVVDIAEEAGLSRALVYRHFSSRDEMVVASVERAGRRLLERSAAAYERAETLADLICGIVVEVVWQARTDPLLASVFGGANRSRTSALVAGSERFLLDHRDAEAQLRRYRPEFLEQLRPGLSFEAAYDYVRTFGAMVAQAPAGATRTKRSLRAYVETFLLPAIVADPPPVP